MQICYCYSKRRNTGGGGREATFSLECFTQNKDLVVKQTNLNDAHGEKLGFGQEKLASAHAIYIKTRVNQNIPLGLLLPTPKVSRGNSMWTENQVTTEVVHLQE